MEQKGSEEDARQSVIPNTAAGDATEAGAADTTRATTSAPDRSTTTATTPSAPTADQQPPAKFVTLSLIDLAGSERIAHTKVEGERLKETQAINKSLSALADVISAMKDKEPHVPYRNSKITFLLQPVLASSSAKVLMIVNLNPISLNESLCSLRFASKVNSCSQNKDKKTE